MVTPADLALMLPRTPEREVDSIAMFGRDGQGDAGARMLRPLESELAAQPDDLLR